MVISIDLAGLTVRIQVAEDIRRKCGVLDPFLCVQEAFDLECRAEIVDMLTPVCGERLYQEPSYQVYRTPEGLVRYLGRYGGSPDNAYMRIERRDKTLHVQYRRDLLPEGITHRLLLDGLEAEHLLSRHRGFLLHASWIEYDGAAILFTAPSETGKSTQAELWCRNQGAELINGDRAAVRIFDDGIKVCGIPFSGSSPVRKNKTMPLRAIVYLTQASTNTVSRLRGRYAFQRVWEGCTVALWDREDVELTTQTVSDVIGCIPVYQLDCTPDVRAVNLLKSFLEVEM